MEIDPVVKYTSPFLRLFCYIKIQVKLINKLHHVLKHACNYIQSLGFTMDLQYTRNRRPISWGLGAGPNPCDVGLGACGSCAATGLNSQVLLM